MDRLAFLAAPGIWALLAGVIFVIYGLSGRLAYINILGIIKYYKNVFTKKRDFAFFMIFPLIIAISSALHANVDEDLSQLMAIVLTILTSMVLSFMVMTNGRYENSMGKEDKDLGDLQLRERNQDALAVGAYEILVSILVLILIFLLPIANGNDTAQRFMSFFIYYGFYSFLLNVFIIVRRLFQIYLNK